MKIAAASCTKIQQIDPQPVWAEIQAEQPDILLLLGDNVYLDRDDHTDPDLLRQELEALYDRQLAEPHFAALLNDLKSRGCLVLATYDDHDFLGNNRCGGEVEPALREAARNELVRAFAPPMTGSDVYSVTHTRLIDIVVLDARYYRTSPHRCADNRDAVLGGVQWAWLEATVAASKAPFLLLASGSTFHAYREESWEAYPGAFERLRGLIGNRRGAFMVTGDLHRNAVYDDSGVVELTTSAVARRGLKFGRTRQNYALLSVDPHGLRVEMRALKVDSRFAFRMTLDSWALP